MSVAGALAAQDDAVWRLASTVEVEGNAAFSTAAIRHGLIWSPAASSQLHDAADDDERQRTLLSCVREGYRHAGFVDVVVEGLGMRGGHAALRVQEGPRCRCGAIRVRGSERVAADAVAAFVREPAKPWDGWRDADFADADAKSLAEAQDRVVAAFEDAGWRGASADVSVVRDGERADLVVTVRDEGHEWRCGKLRIVGERAEDVDAVLARVPLAAQTVMTKRVVQGLRRRFEQLGRYNAVKVDRDPASGDTVVRVARGEWVPAMGEMPWRDLAQVQRALAVLRTELAAGQMLRLRGIGDDTWSGVQLDGRAVRVERVDMELGRDGMRLHTNGLRRGDAAPCSADLMLSATATCVQLGDGACGFATYGPVDLAGQIIGTVDANGSCQVRFGFGISTAAQEGPFRIEWQPAFALAVLVRGAPRRDGEDLFLDIVGQSVRIDAEGALSLVGGDGAATPCVVLSTFADALAATRERFDAAHTKPLLPYVLDALGGQAAADAESAAVRDSLLLVRSAAFWIAGGPLAGPAPAARFEVRGDAAADGMGELVGDLAYDAALWLPGECWATHVLHAVRDAMHHRGEGVRELTGVAIDPHAGPIAIAAAAQVLDLVGYAAQARRCRKLVPSRCTVEAATRDLRELVDDDAPLLASLAAHLRRDATLRGVFTDLGADAPPRAVLERAFARCWEGGLDSWLRGLAARDD